MKSMNDNAQLSRYVRSVLRIVDRAKGERTVFSQTLFSQTVSSQLGSFQSVSSQSIAARAMFRRGRVARLGGRSLVSASAGIRLAVLGMLLVGFSGYHSAVGAPDQAKPAKSPKGRPSRGRKARTGAKPSTPPAKTGDGKKVEIPPDVQRQIDEMMEQGKGPAPAGQTGARRNRGNVGSPARPRRADATPRPGSAARKGAARTTPGAPPKRGAANRPSGGPGGPTTSIDMPPTEDLVPAEDRLYSFSIKGGTYEQLLAGLNRQTGLAILGEAPKDGKVTFVTEEELTFDALLRRVREILFEYKALEHYWLVQKPTHLEVINVNDYYRKLGPEQIYESVEAYRAAQLPDYEIVMVIYTPTGSISALNDIRHFVPDYVRIAPLDNRNAITIFALVKDIEKYLQLIEIFTPGGASSSDIRPLAVIPVEHILPTQAWVDIQSLMNLSNSTSKAKTRGCAEAPNPWARWRRLGRDA